jgi:hypothetical protein
VLDLLHAEAWQVRQEDNSLRVLIVSPHASVNRAAVAERIRDALRVAGAAPIDVLVEDVLSISAGAGGKRPLVVAARH